MHDSTHCKKRVLAKQRLLGIGTESSARWSDSLVLAIYSMDEPWRRRFLILVAGMATHWTWESGEPTPDEVSAWLDSQPKLRRYMGLLLDRWRMRI
jgi:hypothetical protein